MNPKTEAALAQLDAGVAALCNSDQWQEYLDFSRKFYGYSARNTVLIHTQMRGASRVAGYHKWQVMGRQVKKGEKAIVILAPLIKKAEISAADGSSAAGTMEQETETKLVGFRTVSVFDISQTEGEPLPEVVTRLTGQAPEGVINRLETAIRDKGIVLRYEPIPGSTNGYYVHGTKGGAGEIVVDADLAPAQRAKTLAHELAHSILHAEATTADTDRPVAEIEAESTAYIVMQELGIDSGSYSFGYVASWGGGDHARDATLASITRIRTAVDEITDQLAAQSQSEPTQSAEMVMDIEVEDMAMAVNI